MHIYCIWFKDKDGLWLADAWDSASIEEDKEGWEEAIRDVKDRYDEVRIVKVKINKKDIDRVFEQPEIKGEVENDTITYTKEDYEQFKRLIKMSRSREFMDRTLSRLKFQSLHKRLGEAVVIAMDERYSKEEKFKQE